MSRGPQDEKRPGVREQELEVLYNHLKSFIVETAGGCEVPAACQGGEEWKCIDFTFQGASPRAQPSQLACPSSHPLSFQSLPQFLCL